MYVSDSLEMILSHLSTKVMTSIADGSCLPHLNYLLEFLAAWEKRPEYLTPMAYQWCSALSEAAGRLGPSEVTISLPRTLQLILQRQIRLRPQDVAITWPGTAELGFSGAGPGHTPARLDATSCHTPGCPHLLPPIHAYLLSIALEIGFRRITPNRNQSPLYLDHTSHHKLVFETAFSSDDDNVIVDAMRIWIVGDRAPPSSCARHLAKRVDTDKPFSPGLRRASVYVIERIWSSELRVSGLETVRWLDRLNVNVDDVVEKGSWVWLLVLAIRSLAGPENLSPHYWRLLDKLVVAQRLALYLEPRDTEVMRSLENAEDWEKLGIWMVVVWSFLPYANIPTPESMESVEELTLKSLLRRPSALPRFKDLCEAGTLSYPMCQVYKVKLQQICDLARAEQLSLEPSPA